jgi:predicted dehydrogenase
MGGTAMRFGIIGAGRIAPAYLSLAQNFPDIRCVGIADRTMENAAQLAAEWSLSSSSIEDMLRRQDIDTIVNLTPIPAHYAVSRAILDAGKHLYSEKPLTGTTKESQDLLDRARGKSLMIACAPDTFLGAAPQLARRLLDEDLIGDVVGASATFIMDGAHFSQRFFGDQIGPLRELGPYYLTGLLHLLGPVVQLSGIARNGVTERSFGAGTVAINTPSDIRALMQFESGVVADFTVSVDAVATGRAPLEIEGTKGALLLPDPNFFGGDVVHLSGHGARQSFSTEDLPLGALNWDGGRLANYRSVGLADMADALAQKRALRASGEMAAHVAEIIEVLLSGGSPMHPTALKSRFDRPEPLTPDQARTLLKGASAA